MLKMKELNKIIVVFFFLSSTLLLAQQNNLKKMNTKSTNPLLCDVKTGVCGDVTDTSKTNESIISMEKPIRIIYFTDPICSSCWGIEPQLRKLKMEYGNAITIEYRMGGLLPDWSYNSGGISKPADVAHHWDEVSVYYDMPIDGDVWFEDPLDSSFPPSIAFKAAQLQDKKKALLFLRELRELVFLHKINIAKWENMAKAARKVGLDEVKLEKDYNTEAKTLFQEDLKLAREMGVRGFPTVFIINKEGKSEIIYGSKAYPFFEMAVLKLAPDVVKSEYKKDFQSIFSDYSTLTAREFAELSGMPRKDAELFLNEEVNKGVLIKFSTKNGSIWELK